MKYLVRLDDACPTMNYSRWSKIEQILDKYNIKPLVGIVPNNEDPKLEVDKPNEEFWNIANKWQNKDWSIALHGFNHCYISNNAGINPLWNRSEFAGISLDIQKDKIKIGTNILKEKGIQPKYFFAPSHTFDSNTLEALKEVSDIRIISDTIALHPYKEGEFIFIPQQFGHFFNPLLNGMWTFCFHPNTMDNSQLAHFELFIKDNKDKFISFSEIDLSNITHKTILDRIISYLYFAQRRIRKIH